MVFYAGWKSIKAVKCDGEFNYGMSGGVFSYREDYVAELIKEALEFCKNKTFEIGFKYPSFNWKKAGMIKPKTEVIDSPKYDTPRVKGKQSIVKVTRFLYKGYPMTSVSSVGDIENGKREATYGQVELLDPKKDNFNSSYLAVVSRNIHALFDLSKALLGQKESYVKDFDFLVQSKTFGIQALERFDIKFRKGGYMVEGGKTYSKKEEELKENLKNISEKEKRVTFKRAFGYEYDGEFNAKGQKVRQHPLPLDIAYKVALYTLERREKAPMSSKAHGGRTASNLLGNKLSKSYPEFKPTINYAGEKLSLYTIFKESENKDWDTEAQKFIDNERRRGRRAAVIHKGDMHGLYLKAHFAKGGSLIEGKKGFLKRDYGTFGETGDKILISSWDRETDKVYGKLFDRGVINEYREVDYEYDANDISLKPIYPMFEKDFAKGGEMGIGGTVIQFKNKPWSQETKEIIESISEIRYDRLPPMKDRTMSIRAYDKIYLDATKHGIKSLYANNVDIYDLQKACNEAGDEYKKAFRQLYGTNLKYDKGGQIGDVVYFKSGRNKDKIKSGEIYRTFDNEYAIMSNFSQELVDKSDLVDAPKTKTKKFLGFFKDGGSVSMAEYGKMCDC